MKNVPSSPLLASRRWLSKHAQSVLLFTVAATAAAFHQPLLFLAALTVLVGHEFNAKFRRGVEWEPGVEGYAGVPLMWVGYSLFVIWGSLLLGEPTGKPPVIWGVTPLVIIPVMFIASHVERVNRRAAYTGREVVREHLERNYDVMFDKKVSEHGFWSNNWDSSDYLNQFRKDQEAWESFSLPATRKLFLIDAGITADEVRVTDFSRYTEEDIHVYVALRGMDVAGAYPRLS